MQSNSPDLLLERDAELGRLGEGIERAGSGEGVFIVLRGSPGLGKTSLLRLAGRRLQDEGVGVWAARSTPLEQEFAFGVVRQLFSPAVRSAPAPGELFEGPAAMAGRLFASLVDHSPEVEITESVPLLHGLYWLLAKLCDRGTCALLVDDLHWADGPSLGFLRFLQPRLAGLPLLVLGAMRSEGEDASLAAITSDPSATVLELQPLSLEASRRIVRDGLGARADGGFVRACWETTGGNPFYLGELVGQLAAAGVAPVALEAPRVRAMGPDSVRRSLLVRTARIAPDAREIVRALAVLGDAATLRQVRELAGVDEASAAALCGALARAAILERSGALRFAHPIIRSAIRADMSPAELARLHRQAARVLTAEGADPEQIASHLLACDPAAEPGAVEVLRQAAGEAISHAAPEIAAYYLRRALAEPPSRSVRSDVLLELGAAELRAGNLSGAEEHLRRALEEAAPGRARVAGVVDLARALWMSGRADQAGEAIAQEIEQTPERDLVARLEAELVMIGLSDPSVERVVEAQAVLLSRDVPGRTANERHLLAGIATLIMQRGDSAALAVAAAERAFAGGQLIAEQTAGSLLVATVALAFLRADRFDLAEVCLKRSLEDSRRRGSPITLVPALSIRAYLRVRRGEVSEALADAQTAADVADAHGVAVPIPIGFLIEALIERGELAQAQEVLRSADLEGDVPHNAVLLWVVMRRALLRVAQGRDDEALVGLLDVAARKEELRAYNPAGFPWASQAALILAGRGEFERARELIAQELADAERWGGPDPRSDRDTGAGPAHRRPTRSREAREGGAPAAREPGAARARSFARRARWRPAPVRPRQCGARDPSTGA
jgi:tetratricopeptide (TPR) repeat protein